MKCSSGAYPGWEELEVSGSSGCKFCGWLEIEAADAVAALVRLQEVPASLE